MTKGYLYFIEAREVGLIKIGFSISPLSRLNCIQTNCPFKVRLIGFGRRQGKAGPFNDELDFHRRFKCLRKTSEWFTITPTLRRAINTFLREHGKRLPASASKRETVEEFIRAERLRQKERLQEIKRRKRNG